MHAGIANLRFHLKSVAGKTFQAHAQPAILRNSQEAPGWPNLSHLTSNMESISKCQRFVFHFIYEWAHLVSIHFKKKPLLIWQFWSGAYICADNLTSWIMFRTILWNRLDAYISCGSAYHLWCNGKIKYLFQCQIHPLNLHFYVILSGEWKGIIKSWSIRKTFWTKVHIILIFTVQAHPLADQSWIHLMKWWNYRGKLGRYQWWGCYISLR